jgi:predicted transcriptional regulator
VDEAGIMRELSRAVISAGGQAAFAKKAGIPQSTVSMAMTGKRPPADEIANALGYVRRIQFVPMDAR